MADSAPLSTQSRVAVYGLEGLQPEEYDRGINPEGVCKIFDVDASRNVDMQVTNRIVEFNNDPRRFRKLTRGVWIRDDLEVQPLDEKNEQFTVVQSTGEKQFVGVDGEQPPVDMEQAAAAVQEQIESTNALFTLTYSVLADSKEMFTAMSATAKSYQEALLSAGFNRQEALLLVSKYMSDVNQAMHRRPIGGQE